MGIINFNKWENFEYDKYSKYFDEFLNQNIKIPNYSYIYGEINLYLNKNIFEVFKNYLYFKNLNYNIINDSFIKLNNYKNFYIYLRLNAKNNYSLEVYNKTYNEYQTIDLKKIKL